LAATRMRIPLTFTELVDSGAPSGQVFGSGLPCSDGFAGTSSSADGRHEFVSLRTRAGRRFQPGPELQLYPALRSLLDRISGSGGAIAATDVQGPVGIPDLVALTKASPGLSARTTLGLPPLLGWSDVRLVTSAPSGRGASSALIARRAGFDEEGGRRRVQSLIRRGVLLSDGRLVRRPAGLAPMGRVVTFEAKVDDWRRAIAQAARYGSWSDLSVAVMLRLPRDPASAIEYARRMRVGLALRESWLVRPVVYRHTPAVRLHASEHFLAAMTHGLDSCPLAAQGSQSPSAVAYCCNATSGSSIHAVR